MEAVILTILKSFSTLKIYKYYAIISKPQLPGTQKGTQANPFCLKKAFNINYAKTKIMFLEKMFQLSNGQ